MVDLIDLAGRNQPNKEIERVIFLPDGMRDIELVPGSTCSGGDPSQVFCLSLKYRKGRLVGDGIRKYNLIGYDLGQARKVEKEND